mmetsp:Transcript_8902/g.6661  ORF Transcript_8902/g.6661 Transcript_8902/m.6661 type:complete len:98 (+) Transcript_8902:409-702(+)|eukprot:CAMPEP_0202964190 /NCGR_PEP_ID=MMETSP1396-20130829/8269_1 /ASSEMBLY_ACC=CAM_ASM_000872 /TAXON_ID= /ORGANISM="Pseudokeronopsis sp., Strain Brazil" /LENGTH=97 /DNA_ID=CAMNT_0049686101 /DNA_START=801 /DNA_END=1094 /DNA_ORIENTATION=+
MNVESEDFMKGSHTPVNLERRFDAIKRARKESELPYFGDIKTPVLAPPRLESFPMEDLEEAYAIVDEKMEYKLSIMRRKGVGPPVLNDEMGSFESSD